MKGFYFITISVALLFSFSLMAQNEFLQQDQESKKSLEIQKILAQYEQNQMLDNDLPLGWEYSTSDKVHIISIFISSNPNLCEVPIEPGDYIGVFYIDDNGEEACGGAGVWTGTANVPLVAYGDDSYTAGKDGFTSGDELLWRVYSYSLGELVFPATPDYDPSYASNNKFYAGGLSIVIELEYFYDNNISIPSGWSGVSSYTKTSSFPPIIGNVLSPLGDKFVLLQDMQKLYYPGAGINTMFIWTNGKGYKIKLTDEATLPMMGCPVDETSVSLSSTWNICPVLSKCNVLVSDIFNPILDKLIVIKEIGGNKIYWPDMGIQTLYVFEPGRAYYVAVSQNTSITYGDCQSYKSHPEPVESVLMNNTPWNTPAKTGASHTIAFPANVIQSLNSGDYIAAFNANGICVGMSQIADATQALPLTVYGDDPYTAENDGMQDGGEMMFRVYKTASHEVLNVDIEFSGNFTNSNGFFADNGISVVSALKLSATGISAIGSDMLEIFPNPAGHAVNIMMNTDERYNLSLQNLNGQQVMVQSFTGQITLDVSALSRGVYFIEISNQHSKNISKLVLK